MKALLSAFFIIFMLLVASFILNHIHKKAAVPQEKKKISLLIMATGRYLELAQQLIDSARIHFCANHDVTYVVFTDGHLPPTRDLMCVYQAHMGWPYDTMMRFHTYYKNQKVFADADYVFACDADMRFGGCVGDEILGDRVATVHPQVRFRRGPYETNPLSTACVARSEGSHYFAGAFYGGKREEFITLVRTCANRVDIDLARGYIARINDESHLNRYFIDAPPTIVLPPAYCHFESWRSPYIPKLVAFDDPVHDKDNRRRNSTLNPLDYFKRCLQELMVKN